MKVQPNGFFDPIEYLGLQQLSAIQKQNLFRPLLADIAQFIINAFVIKLDKNKLSDFELQLEKISKNPKAILELMSKIDSEFEEEKVKLLEIYRQNFRLQKFLYCL